MCVPVFTINQISTQPGSHSQCHEDCLLIGACEADHICSSRTDSLIAFCLSEHGALTCVCQAQSTTTHYFYLAFNSQAGSCWLCFLFFPLQISNRWFVQASPCQTHQVRFLESCSHSGWRSAACSSTQNLCQRELWSEPKKPGFVKGLLSQVLISYYYYHTVKNHLKSHFTFFLYSHLQAYMS